MEGPYDHESEHYLRYSTLILVAGGIGVVPFFAILEEISEKLYRSQNKNKNINKNKKEEEEKKKVNLPKEIIFIWSVKHATELKTIETLSQKARCLQESSPSLSLKTHIFVTQETEPDLESSVQFNGNCYIETEGNREGGEEEGTNGVDSRGGGGEGERVGEGVKEGGVKGGGGGGEINPIMPLAGTGCPLTSFFLVLFSTLGTILSIFICEKFVIYPFDFGTYKIFPFWLRGTLVFFSIFFGVGIFGGIVVLWYFFSARIGNFLGFFLKSAGGNGNLSENGEGRGGGDEGREEREKEEREKVEREEGVISVGSCEIAVVNGVKEERRGNLFSASDVTYGSRPNFSEIFDSVNKKCFSSYEKHLGVLVSGPVGLQQTVAKECRKRQGFCTESTTAFHFHSVSFEL